MLSCCSLAVVGASIDQSIKIFIRVQVSGRSGGIHATAHNHISTVSCVQAPDVRRRRGNAYALYAHVNHPKLNHTWPKAALMLRGQSLSTLTINQSIFTSVTNSGLPTTSSYPILSKNKFTSLAQHPQLKGPAFR